MTDEKKPEAMTAERMEEIRGRVREALDFGPSRTWDHLLEHDVPALLSALEEARAQAEAELDARKMAETNLEASERNAEANLSLAQQFEHERDALAARVAELEGALAPARRLLKDVVGDLRRPEQTHATPNGPEIPLPPWKASLLRSAEEALAAMRSAAPPEKAPAPDPTERIERAAAAGTAGLLLDVQRDFGRLAKAARRLIVANHGEIDTEEGQAEGLAAEAEVLALIGEESDESASVMVHCSPRVADEDDCLERDQDGTPIFRHAPDCPGFCDFGCGGEEIKPTAPAADPLCARDLGGRKCGQPESAHAIGRCVGFQFFRGEGRPAEPCPCPGFVPEPSGVVAYCRAETPAGCPTPDLFRTEPCTEKCPTPHPCEPAPSGVGDGGAARTCETCAHWGVECRFRPVSPCAEWSPKSGGSNTEGGETP